ncbi:SidA/IucD/PvdA family monooxygenase [Kibdelosporangium persicum]|uniref:SidA/IucD/PvdA family monooxygenase n=1 Tax=Kibdelosporangium persicum TaxID=2698649 RepID=UPI0028A63032|nr:SidA/IucD/PvdA family monooxygenase [Kibdelosporangium persicum]
MLGVGFGPANIALAIAIEEARQDGMMPPCDVRFLEGQTDPEWQGGMLLTGSDIQHNPARDLATLRNPRSHYTFINYLHLSGRLLDHLNVPGEFPLRRDYAGYIRWARGHFDHLVDYGQKVATVAVTEHEGERVYEVNTVSGARYLTRCLVAGPGRTPYVPEPFASVDDDRIFHFTEYLYRVEALPEPPGTVVVIGGSQSSVEILLDLSRRFPDSRVLNYVRSFGLRLKDTSPFSEEGFFPAFTEYYFAASRPSKAVLDAYMRPTNYSSADGDVLRELYLDIYEQKLKGRQHVFVSGNRLVRSVDVRPDAVTLTVAEVNTGLVDQVDADLVVLATGFRDLGPGVRQEPLPGFLTGIAEHVVFDGGYPSITADYQVETPSAPPLFLNGLCETTHGIGDSGSFSLLSLRTAAIQRRLATFARAAPRQLDRLGERP